MNNLLSYCGLVEARTSASEKDLPVTLNRLVTTNSTHHLTQLIIAAHNCRTNWIYNTRVQKFELTCCKVSIGFEKAGVDK